MRYDPLLHRKGRAARSGIAVMFALGILALVIVAVLIFSRRAVVDRKVASAYATYDESKELAQSAFGRAILQLKKNAALGTSFYSGGAGDDDFDWLWKLDPYKRILQQDKNCPVRWHNVLDSNGHILGRYAYIVIGEDRLKLNAILDHRFCSTNPKSKCNGYTGADAIDDCPRLKRRGNSASELQFAYSVPVGKITGTYPRHGKFSGYFTDPAVPAKFRLHSGITSGNVVKGTINIDTFQNTVEGNKVVQYQSPEHFVLKRNLTKTADTTYGRIMLIINSWFNISQSAALDEPDAWFGGNTQNASKNAKDKNEFFQRFPIRQKIGYPGMTWDEIAALSGDGDSAVNYILKSAVPFYTSKGEPEKNNTAGIPWLTNWKENSGNWPDAATKSKQIAANLINYCASETQPVVSNINPENWYGESSFRTDLKYTGNKRTWYLNECGIVLEIEPILGDAVEHKNGETTVCYSFGDGTKKNQIVVRLHILPEIINMYGKTTTFCCSNCGTKLSDPLPAGNKCTKCSATITENKLPGAASDYRVVGFANLSFKFMRDMSYRVTGSAYHNDPGTIDGNFHRRYACMGSSLYNVNDKKPSKDADKVKCQSTQITKAGTIETYETFAFGKSGVHYIEETFTIDGAFACSSNNPSPTEIMNHLKVKDIVIDNLALFLKTECLGSTDKIRYVDCSFLSPISLYNGADDALPIPATASTTPAVKKYFSVSDPRHNLHQGDWEETTETLGSVNANYPYAGTGATWDATSGWDKDLETATDPAGGTISTAFIRHAPVESLWELGAIHRAAPWQTINLKKPGTCSDTLATNLTAAGGDSYGKGDFRILDQVTMQGGTSYTPVAQFGRINLNATKSGVRTFTFDSLFRYMYWSPEGDYTDLDKEIDTKSSTDVNLFDVGQFNEEFPGLPESYYDPQGTGTIGSRMKRLTSNLGAPADTASVRLYRRSDVYQSPSNSGFWDLIEKNPVDGTTALTTDAQQEQLIGRIIGLTEARTMPDSAIVIVLAQTIQDIGGGTTVYHDWNGDGTINNVRFTTATAESYKPRREAAVEAGYFYKVSSIGNSSGISSLNVVSNPMFFTVPTLTGSSISSLSDTIVTKYGRFDIGADRITGETKFTGRLQYDQNQGRWKIVQVKYED